MSLSSYEQPRRPRMTRRVLRGFDAQAFTAARRNKGISAEQYQAAYQRARQRPAGTSV